MDKSDTLYSWKDIAKHLDVEIRTCQRWEKDAGLPVHRYTDTPRSRVFTTTSELDEWLNRSKSKNNEIPRNKLSFLKKSIFPISFFLIMISILFMAFDDDKDPANFKINGRELIIVNSNGNELWKYDTGHSGLMGTDYYQKSSQQRRITPEYTAVFPLIHISDINSDGENEVIFVPHTNDLKNSNYVVILDSEGNIQSKIKTGKESVFGSIKYRDEYFVEGFLVTDLDSDGKKEILIKSNHIPMFPTQLLVTDIHGKTIGEYWNSGRISDIVLLNVSESKSPKILISGINNEYDKGFLAVFDFHNISGNSPQMNKNYRLAGSKKSSELFYILFPRTDLDLLDNLHGNCDLVSIHSDKSISVQMKHTKNLYQFNLNMICTDIKFSDTFKFNHNKEMMNNRISRALNDEYKSSLMKNLLYFNGKYWTNRCSRSN